MTPWLIGLGATTLGILLVLLVVLLGHLRRLAQSLQNLQRELVPLLEEIQAGSAKAQGHLSELERRRQVLQRRPGRIEGRR
jgi:hypothetical protein